MMRSDLGNESAGRSGALIHALQSLFLLNTVLIIYSYFSFSDTTGTSERKTGSGDPVVDLRYAPKRVNYVLLYRLLAVVRCRGPDSVVLPSSQYHLSRTTPCPQLLGQGIVVHPISRPIIRNSVPIVTDSSLCEVIA